MDFHHSDRSLELQERVRQFMRTHVEPVEELYYEQVKPEATRYKTPQVLQDLKRLAREQGLWNLFLSGEHGDLNTRPDQPRICAREGDHGPHPLGARSVQLLGA